MLLFLRRLPSRCKIRPSVVTMRSMPQTRSTRSAVSMQVSCATTWHRAPAITALYIGLLCVSLLHMRHAVKTAQINTSWALKRRQVTSAMTCRLVDWNWTICLTRYTALRWRPWCNDSNNIATWRQILRYKINSDTCNRHVGPPHSRTKIDAVRVSCSQHRPTHCPTLDGWRARDRRTRHRFNTAT